MPHNATSTREPNITQSSDIATPDVVEIYITVTYYVARRPCLVSLGESSWTSLGRDSNGLKRNLEAQGLDQVGGLSVNLQLAVGVGQVQSGDLWDVLVLSLTLLLLQLERDSSNGTLLNSLHQVGGVTSDLVSESLGRDLGDLRGQSLVGLEVQSQLRVESLDQHLGGSLDSFSSNATLDVSICIG